MERNTNSGYTIHTNKPGRSNSVLGNLFGNRSGVRDVHKQNNNNTKRNRFNLGVYSVIGTLLLSTIPLPARASDDGGSGATVVAQPQASSSGSVTNQAVQVLNGSYFQQYYGSGVACQGITLGVTPFYMGGLSAPGFEARSDYGMSMTIAMPLDFAAVDACKARAAIENTRQQAEADKAVLDYQLVRALKCTELIKAGAFIHPQSPYVGLCNDIVAVDQAGNYRNGAGVIVSQQSSESPKASQQETSP